MEQTLDSVDTELAKIRKTGLVPNIPIPENWNPKHTLRNFQRVGAIHLLIKKRFILGDPTGSGKTPTEIFSWGAVRDTLLREGRAPRMWIVATKSGAKQWEEEVENFLLDINVYRVPSETPQPDRVSLVQDWISDNTGAVLIQNWTQFTQDWDKIKALGDPKPWLAETELVFDEAQKLKNPESKLYQVAWDVANNHATDRVHGLTATLVKNKAEDSQAIVDLICPGIITRLEFENLYCVMGKKWIRPNGSSRARKATMITGYYNLEDYAQRIAPVYMGRTDDEIEGERPEVTFMHRSVAMSREHRLVYEEAEQGLMLSDPEHAAAALVHAQQAANNPEIWYNEQTGLSHKTQKNAKADLLKELFEEELKDQPRIVFSHLETTVSAYEKQLAGYKPVRITGKENDAEREAARLAFQSGQTDTILITNAGSESLNLQRAKHVVLLNRPWDPGSLVQVVGRARRFGSHHQKVVVWLLSCHDSIDELVDAVLCEKFGPFEQILGSQGNFIAASQILPKEIVEYARRKRIQEAKSRRPA